MDKSYFELFQESLKEDLGYLLSWHCNIAMFFHDNCGIQDYLERNEMAYKFIKKIFGINYDWKKLMDSGGKDG